MTAPVELMGAGLRAGEAIAVIADCDEAVMVSIADGIGAATIAMPAYAARHLGEQLMRKAAEVESASPNAPGRPTG